MKRRRKSKLERDAERWGAACAEFVASFFVCLTWRFIVAVGIGLLRLFQSFEAGLRHLRGRKTGRRSLPRDAVSVSDTAHPQQQVEAQEALVHLGFSKRQASARVSKALVQSGKASTTEQLIRTATQL